MTVGFPGRCAPRRDATRRANPSTGPPAEKPTKAVSVFPLKSTPAAAPGDHSRGTTNGARTSDRIERRLRVMAALATNGSAGLPMRSRPHELFVLLAEAGHSDAGGVVLDVQPRVIAWAPDRI